MTTNKPYLRLVTPTSVTETEIPVVSVTLPEMPAVEVPLKFEVFYEGKPTGPRAATYREALAVAMQLMELHQEWKHVKVLEDGKKFIGGVWRRDDEFRRLICSKELG